jgi:hypothetical protein
MPSTFYKGDVSEVTMGHETGIFIEHNEPCTWTNAYSTSTPDYSTITFLGNGGSTSIFKNGVAGQLQVPQGMLIGCRFSFHSTSGNYTSHSYKADSSKVFTIIDHVADSSDRTTLTIVPAIKSDSLASASGDVLFIHTTGVPSIAIFPGDGVSYNNPANSDEWSAIDQFIGLASFMTLPDTTVELHQHHVVGLGRQATILQPGRLNHMGGSIEMPLHSPRWLYYAMGREVVNAHTMISNYSKVGGGNGLEATIAPGQTYLDIDSVTFGGDVTLTTGDYILVKDQTRAATVYHKQPDEGSTDFWPGTNNSSSSLVSDAHHFEATETSEIRRVVGIEAISTGHRVYVDDPFYFPHDTSDLLYLYRYAADHSTGSPDVQTDRTIRNPIHKLIFSGDTIPSFCMEHSIRNRDVGSHGFEDGGANTPGSSTDSKQLTRVFKGCKIAEWEISSTVDAELKFRCIFDALACYTDTGRLETSSPGDRYVAHRMFQNTAETAVKRKDSGIAEGSEKPFMFYNGSIEMFGETIANVAAFELRGKTGTELYHITQGNPLADAVNSDGRVTKQIPYGGTRNAAIIREGREEFEMEVDVYIGDPLLWNELRTHRNVTGTAGATGGIMNLFFTKPTTGSTYSTPSLRILVDDYVITEAPIPVPDDKGLLRTKIKLRMKNVKVVSYDTMFHS